ncbi:translesion DNA synthesis-associated protein ImuA [Pseudomonadales bacterium]|nr:translesion DNA synthesis-associated protein ImuA [Pseudomonadales bacterium]
MPIHKKNQTAGKTVANTMVQPALMQQSFIQTTLPFAAPEITPKMTPSFPSSASSSSLPSSPPSSPPKKSPSQGLLYNQAHKRTPEPQKEIIEELIEEPIKEPIKESIKESKKEPTTNGLKVSKIEETLKTKEASKTKELSKINKGSETKAPTQASKQAYADLLKHPQLWRGKDLTKASATHTVASGYSALDDCLAGGGWPNAGLVDFILPHAGIGELRLLLPALTTLAENRWLAWINPPFTPYAPALEAAGIDSSKILLIYTKSHEEMLWAMERTCKSGSCGAVLVWPDERKLSLKETRRVQLAAKQGTTLSVLFRPIEASSKASLAELRLALSPGKDPLHLSVDIIKRRGGWPVKGLTLPIAAVTQSQYTSAHAVRQKLSLWRDQWQGLQFQQEALQEALQKQRDDNFTKVSSAGSSEDSFEDSFDDYVESYVEGFSEGNSTNTSAPSLH